MVLWRCMHSNNAGRSHTNTCIHEWMHYKSEKITQKTCIMLWMLDFEISYATILATLVLLAHILVHKTRLKHKYRLHCDSPKYTRLDKRLWTAMKQQNLSETHVGICLSINSFWFIFYFGYHSVFMHISHAQWAPKHMHPPHINTSIILRMTYVITTRTEYIPTCYHTYTQPIQQHTHSPDTNALIILRMTYASTRTRCRSGGSSVAHSQTRAG